MQNQRKIEIKYNGFDIIIIDNEYTVVKDKIVLDGTVSDLSKNQKVWLDNVITCTESFINTLNFDGHIGI